MSDVPSQLQYHQAVKPDQLPAYVEALLAQARDQQQVVVLATGVFDLLHQEHMAFLRKAKAVGDVLIVGIESDSRVKELKGESRPINPDLVRRQHVEDLGVADAVFILPNEFSTPEAYRAFTHHLRPQILAVSSHTSFQDRKQRLMEEVGGEVKVVHEHNPAISTTILLEQNQRII